MAKGNHRRAAAIICALLTAIAALAWAAFGRESSAQTDPVVSVDTISDAANTATSIGTIDPCLSTSTGASIPVDIVIQDISSISGLEADLLYDPAVLSVTAVSYDYLLSSAGVLVLDMGDLTPDTDGDFKLGAVTFPLASASGSGVLARLTIEAVGSGTSPLDLQDVKLSDGNAQPVAPSDSSTQIYLGPVHDGWISVDEPCPPDTDSDGVPDPFDNCPSTPNADQRDLDGDQRGDACDGDIDGDHYWNVQEQDMGSDAADGGKTPDICDGIDNDSDTEVDEGYDLNGNGTADCSDAAADTDGDGIANPTDEDDDGDGITDREEARMALDTLAPCPLNPSHYAWMPDVDNNQFVNVGDVLKFIPHFLSKEGQPAFNRRFDWNGDGAISMGDILMSIPYFLTGCSP